MLNWNAWQGDATAWDALLLRFPDYTAFQSFQWGELRRRSGWVPHRLAAVDSGEAVAMTQVLVRRFPLGHAVAWVPGGPVGAVEAWDDSFRSALRESIGAPRLYCRVSPMREHVAQDEARMSLSGWREALVRMNSGISLSYSPSESDSVRLAQASHNWRHNLRRSLKSRHSASLWPDPAPDEMLAVYKAMQSHKNLEEQISRDALISILEVLGKQCVVVRCLDEQKRLLALRGAILFGTKAWDVFAAATPEGRKVYASHAAFWELMRECASRGIEWYDMSGVDPIGNKGVYDFKRGTGARDLRYLGEWDWATSGLLRRTANYAIRRSGRMTHAG